ncbi:MAG TPA: hypothetical protein VNQ76_15440, partial [Planctomicrobium sp.]|nr:hypothetical protein [Planctomicrobium sp.]
TIAGIIGGVITGQIACALGVLEPRGLGGIMGNVVSGSLGGAILTALFRMILKRNYEARQKAANQDK